MPGKRWASDPLFDELLTRVPEFHKAQQLGQGKRKHDEEDVVLNIVLRDLKNSPFCDELDNMDLNVVGTKGTEEERDKQHIIVCHVSLFYG